MAWITNGARLYRMRRIHRKLPEITQIPTVRSTRHARHLLFLFPDDYGTLLPPKPSFSSFMEPVLSSLTVTIVLLFALEPSSLHENIVLLYVALQLPLFQCFRFWETWRVITLHFMKKRSLLLSNWWYSSWEEDEARNLETRRGEMIKWEIEQEGGGKGRKRRR